MPPSPLNAQPRISRHYFVKDEAIGHYHVEVFYFEISEILETRAQQFQWLSSLARRPKWPLLCQCDNARSEGNSFGPQPSVKIMRRKFHVVKVVPNGCPFRKVRFVRNDGVVRQGSDTRRWPRSARSDVCRARLSRAKRGSGPHCTTRQHNTHRTEEREVLYPWHPWFGRRVFVHEVLVRGNQRVFRCSEAVQAADRRLAIPEWMFERAACCGMARAESPRVNRAALDGLKALILEAFGATAGAMIEARPRSFSLEGEADEMPRTPSSYPTTRTVSSRQPKTRVAPTACGGTRESDAPDGAHAAGAAEAAGPRPGDRRARQ
jgi:hypothetical protein